MVYYHDRALLLLSLAAFSVSGLPDTHSGAAVVGSARGPDIHTWPMPDVRSEKQVVPSAVVGAAHGKLFDDAEFVDAQRGHKRISYITLAGCGDGEHVSAMKIGFRDNHVPEPQTSTFITHGQYSGKAPQTMLLIRPESYITSFQVTVWHKKLGLKRHTRIGWIKVINVNGDDIECGSRSPDDISVDLVAPGNVLLYLSGSDGDALDSLQGHSIKKEHYL